MTGLQVHPTAVRRGAGHFDVLDGTGLVARLEVGRSRRPLRSSGAAGSDPADRTVAAPADRAAWPTASAARAALHRWHDRHPTIAVVTALDLEAGAAGHPAAVLEAVGAHLATSGTRRLDVRIKRVDPVADTLVGPRWIDGEVDGDLVASLQLQYPWSRPDLATTESRVPGRVRRLGRRLRAVHPRQAPELIRVAWAEVTTAARLRYAPGGARSAPPEGSPPGTFPFAVTRYRTIRAALALVPPALRSTTFVDIGCGDGRVLREAIEAGFAQVHGRELDPELAERATAAIGRQGTVQVGDALLDPLPDDAGVIYLNNPFTSERLDRLADQLADTLRRQPRPLLVIYINPRPIDALERAGLVLVDANPQFSVLVTRETGR